MKKCFYIDFPSPFSTEGDWINAKICKTKKEAEEFLNNYGIPKEFHSIFITEGQDK